MKIRLCGLFKRYVFLLPVLLSLALVTGCAGVSHDVGGQRVSGDRAARIFIPPAPSVSGAPVLLFTDLVRGPSGSMITVWGQNLSHDSVLFCGNDPCEILSLDFDLRHPAHGRQAMLQKIVVRFRAGDGITLAGANTLPFQLTNGDIHMVEPGPITLRGVSAGDVVYLRGGKYSSAQPCYGRKAIICGKGNSGIAVVGYPGETAVLDCNGMVAFDAYVGTLSDFTLANVEMDCGGVGLGIAANRRGNRRNLRIVGNYLHDGRSGNSGAFGTFNTTVDLYVLGNSIERTGIAGENNAHAIYHGGVGTSSNVNISYNRIDTHLGGRPIQVFGHMRGESMTGLVIRGNHISNARGNAGILVSHSDFPRGVSPGAPSRGWIKDAVVDFNTVEDSAGAGISIRNSGVNVRIDDNILINVSRAIYIDFAKTASLARNCSNAPIVSRIKATLLDNEQNYPACL